MTETVADMMTGDKGETIMAMNVRAEIDFRSEIVGSLQEGTSFTIVETGDSHRALISAGNTTGWISTKTDLDQPLTKKIQSGQGCLPIYENMVPLSVREDSDFKSSVVESLPEGSQFELIEEGTQHRVKILFDGVIGWITAKTNLDQPLISQVNAERVTKMSKNLDSYVVRVASQSQVTRVLSSKSLGSKAERTMGRSRSTDSSDGRNTAQKSANAGFTEPSKTKSAKVAPPLSKMACCCGS